MFPRTRVAVAWLFAGITIVLCGVAHGQEPTPPKASAPRVWIFNGTPGDDEHHTFYEKNLARLRQAFTRRLGVSNDNLTILYGPKSAGYDGACTRENLLAEVDKAVAAASDGNPVWLIFEGHSNPTGTGANFNLPGPDVSARELSERLASVKPDATVVVIFTTSSSGRFLRLLAGPGRMVLTATLQHEEDNETEFPEVLAKVLENPTSDQDGDEKLSLLEIFNACNQGVKAAYDTGKYMQRERAMLDGNGDRRGTQRPSREDAEPAATAAFTVSTPRESFD